MNKEIDELLKRKTEGRLGFSDLDNLLELLISERDILSTKRERLHVISYVSHKILDFPELEKRAELIVDGLADKLPADTTENYKFKFDSVGLYLPSPEGGLTLLYGFGKLDEKISAYDSRAGYKEHLKFGGEESSCTEIVIPLVANHTYQGAIIISNEASGREIDFKGLFNFFHHYGDMSAGAIYTGIIHQKLVKENQEKQKLLEELATEIEEKQILLQKFKDASNTMVHDLKNPLIAVNGFAKMISKNLEKVISFFRLLEGPTFCYDSIEISKYNELVKKQKELSELVVETSAYIGGFVNNLLDYMRVESGYKLNPVQCDIDKMITRSISRFKDRAEKKNMQYTITHQLNEKITADPKILGRAIENLLGNAVVHGEQDSIIEVGVERRDNGIDLYVSNKGSIKEPDKIFDPFYTTGPKNICTGLGCTSIKQNIELHGGRVEFGNYSTNNEPRVYFKIFLPQ